MLGNDDLSAFKGVYCVQMVDRVAKSIIREKRKEGEGVVFWGSGGLPPAKIAFLTLSRARGDLGVLFSDSAQ